MSGRPLADAQWARIEGHLPGRAGLPGRSGADNRPFVDAVPWLARSATRVRQVDRRARALSTMAGVWERLFNALAEDPNFEYVLIDRTICKAHADATGARED